MPKYKRKSKHKEILERKLLTLNLYRQGNTLEKIGTEIGVTRERVRQIVKSTIIQLGINESIERGIEIDTDVLIQEEKKNRNERIAKLTRKDRNINNKKKKWSRDYSACRECGGVNYPHLRHGKCQKCMGCIMGIKRENIIKVHNNLCDKCGLSRNQAKIEYGKDFYITKQIEVLCQKCFRVYAGRVMGKTPRAYQNNLSIK